MKDQTNMIIAIVAWVVALGCATAFWFTKRPPVTLPAPTAVPTAEVQPAEGAVVYANALPNAGQGQSAGGGSGAPGGGGAGGRAMVGGGGGGFAGAGGSFGPEDAPGAGIQR